MDATTIYNKVSEHYSASALGTNNTQYGQSVAKSFGYTEEELASIPAESNLGLSCGNPLAIASLKEGETLIDLGSGAGFDVFLASKQVGPSGRAIGVDMNKDMLTLATANKTKAGSSADNISFIESQITAIDLPDTIANCIISNCVINLVPEEDKPRVFAEMYRLLKPGGRVAVSDILAKKPLPETLRNSMALYAGCIAGASLVSQYEGYLKEAGFEEILIADTNADLNVYIDTLPDGTKRVRKQQGESQSSCCAPAPAAAQSCCAPAPMVQQSACCSQTPSSTPCCSKEKLAGGCCKDGMAEEGCCDSKVDKKAVMEELNAMLQTLDLNEWVGSFKVYAVKH